MKRFLVIVLLFLALPLWSATLAPSAAFIETNGAFITIYWTNASTTVNGTYTQGFGGFSFGMGTNNSITGNEKVVLSMYSPGFDSTVTSNWLAWTNFGTSLLRQPYPNSTNCAVFTNTTGAGMVSSRIALKDFVFSADTNYQLVIASSLWSNNATVTLFATNNSTLTYSTAKVIGNATMPDFQMFNTTTFQFPCFGHSGLGPLAAVVVQATDRTGHTNIVTNATATVSSDGNLEYLTTMDASTITNWSVVYIDYTMYPLRGDTTSVLDTRTATFASGTPFPHTHKWLCNKNGLSAVAIVGPTGTSGGRATTNFNSASPPAIFDTIANAAIAIKDTNNQSFFHNDASGGTIYVIAPYSLAYTSVPDDTMNSYLTIASYPTNTTYYTITNGPGSGRTGSLLCWSNCTFNVASDKSFIVYNHKANWVRDSYITNRSGSLWDRGIMYFTGNVVSNNTQGFAAAESSQQPPHLIRGNSIYGANTPWEPWTVMQNTVYATNSLIIKSDTSGQLYRPDYMMFGRNRFTRLITVETIVLYNATETLTNGAIFYQNELQQADGGGPTVTVHADGATGPITNLHVMDCTFDNQRFNGPSYADSGSSDIFTIFCTVKNTVGSRMATKSDTHTTANAARIGNWPLTWGVGSHGNFFWNGVDDTPAGFAMEYHGVWCFQPARQFPGIIDGVNVDTTATNYVKFVSNAVTNGNANLRLQSSSPAIATTLVRARTFPRDLEGNYVGAFDPPGAYVSGNIKRGGFF